MKRVLVLQHLSADGPAYLGTWLQREGHAFEVLNSEMGQACPPDLRDCRALAVLGGEMSANDPLSSLRDAQRLILEAIDHGVPVLGHCLGGQLMARALGARVVDSPAPEIGWHRMQLLPHHDSTAWFGDADAPVVFQWHYDAFELPPGARLLAYSDTCPQAFSIGPHLAMQFHVELDEPKLRAWTTAHDERFLASAGAPTVQSLAEMQADAHRRLAAQQRLADRIYSRWMALAPA